MQLAKIKNFQVLKTSHKREEADNWHYLYGYVFDHPRGEGCTTTSPLKFIDFERKIAVTKNTIYELV